MSNAQFFFGMKTDGEISMLANASVSEGMPAVETDWQVAKQSDPENSKMLKDVTLSLLIAYQKQVSDE